MNTDDDAGTSTLVFNIMVPLIWFHDTCSKMLLESATAVIMLREFVRPVIVSVGEHLECNTTLRPNVIEICESSQGTSEV